MVLHALTQALTAETQPGSDLHCYYSRLLLEAEEIEEASSSIPSKDVSGAGEGFGPGMASGSKYAFGLCYKAYSTRYVSEHTKRIMAWKLAYVKMVGD